MASLLQRLSYAARVAAGKIDIKGSPYDFLFRALNTLQAREFNYLTYVEEAFFKNPTVHSAIMFKVRAITQAPLLAHINDDDNPEKLPSSHPLQQVMMYPNPEMSGFDLQAIRVMMYNIIGNSYVYIARDAAGMPTGLYPLRPDRVYEIIQAPDRIDYAYVPLHAGLDSAVPILREDMIHDKIFNPLDEYEGYGRGETPLRASARIIEVDNKFTDFLWGMVKGGVMPLSLLTSDQYLSPKDMDQARRRFRATYGGADKWTEPLVLGQGFEYQKLGMTLEEMVFQDLDARDETRILATLGITPLLVPTIIGMQSSTYTNQEKARRGFWEDIFAFELKVLAGSYNRRLNMNMQYKFMYDLSKVPALAGDINLQSQVADRLWRMGVPRNDALEIAGIEMEDTEGGDISFVENYMVPADTLINPPEPEPVPNEGFMARQPEDIPGHALEEMVRDHAIAVKALRGEPRKLTYYFKTIGNKATGRYAAKYNIKKLTPQLSGFTKALETLYASLIQDWENKPRFDPNKNGKNNGHFYGQNKGQDDDELQEAIEALPLYLQGLETDNVWETKTWITDKTIAKIRYVKDAIQTGTWAAKAHTFLVVDSDIVLTTNDVDDAIAAVSDQQVLYDLINASTMN